MSARTRQRQPGEPATLSDVKRQTKNWSVEILICRSNGHAWTAYDAVHFKRQRYFRARQVCIRCTTMRTQEIGETGLILRTSLTYPAGYLSSVGRLNIEGRGVVRLGALLGSSAVTTADEIEDEVAAARQRQKGA